MHLSFQADSLYLQYECHRMFVVQSIMADMDFILVFYVYSRLSVLGLELECKWTFINVPTISPASTAAHSAGWQSEVANTCCIYFSDT